MHASEDDAYRLLALPGSASPPFKTPRRGSNRSQTREKKKRARRGKMASFSPDLEYPISVQNPSPNFAAAEEEEADSCNALEFQSEQNPGMPFEKKDPWPKKKKKKNQVLLEGYVATDGSNDPLFQDQQPGMMSRTKSLTDGDLDELKGCVDLGFGFSYDEIPELCNTLPALELCYSMSQKFLDEQQQQKSPDGADAEVCSATSTAASPIANWRISAPGMCLLLLGFGGFFFCRWLRFERFHL
ncbi:hypothetical protein ACLOJK_009040 [Asimina triloba]